MRRALALAAGMLAAGAGAQDAATVFDRVAPSVFTVVARQADGVASGSAVVIAYGRLATNLHVVRGAQRIEVRQGASAFEARVEAQDEARDLALLRADAVAAPPLPLGRTQDLRIGQNVYAVGSPRGLELSLSAGIVSARRVTPLGELIQTTAPISPGSSGGGLFDQDGRLIGLTTMQVVDGQNLNFAIPVEWLQALGVEVAAAPPPPAATAVAANAPPDRPVMGAAPAAAPSPAPAAAAGKAERPSPARLVFWLLVPVALLALAKPGVDWLSEWFSRVPAPSAQDTKAAARAMADLKLEPYRRLAREELKSGTRDTALWLEALQKGGGDENRALLAYVELRAQLLRKAELDRKWAQAVAQSRDGGR